MNFKVGDRVKCVNVSMRQDGSGGVNGNYRKYLDHIGTIVVIDEDILDVNFDTLGRRRMYAWRYERAKPSQFGVDIKFDNVDDAIALATKLAQEFGRPVGVISQ